MLLGCVLLVSNLKIQIYGICILTIHIKPLLLIFYCWYSSWLTIIWFVFYWSKKWWIANGFKIKLFSDFGVLACLNHRLRFLNFTNFLALLFLWYMTQSNFLWLLLIVLSMLFQRRIYNNYIVLSLVRPFSCECPLIV